MNRRIYCDLLAIVRYRDVDCPRYCEQARLELARPRYSEIRKIEMMTHISLSSVHIQVCWRCFVVPFMNFVPEKTAATAEARMTYSIVPSRTDT